MRPPCHIIRPAPESLEAVKHRMQAAKSNGSPFFTIDDVAAWLVEIDGVLDHTNAMRAAYPLIRKLCEYRTVTKASGTLGYFWSSGPLPPSTSNTTETP